MIGYWRRVMMVELLNCHSELVMKSGAYFAMATQAHEMQKATSTARLNYVSHRKPESPDSPPVGFL
jgi:hypothetical protein